MSCAKHHLFVTYEATVLNLFAVGHFANVHIVEKTS
jgi:hypothetical protein